MNIKEAAKKWSIPERTVSWYCQKKYIDAMRKHDVTFGVGPAGTGKTYLAVALALAALREGKVARIILTRPAVEAGEALGFLPGDLYEKITPYLRPLYDALHDMLPAEEIAKHTERGTIEIAPLAAADHGQGNSPADSDYQARVAEALAAARVEWRAEARKQ